MLSSFLYPKIPLQSLPKMLWISCVGALIAALYGIVHDQVSYTISPEYFTRVKFKQFHYAEFGLPPRLFVAEIGALATWWVGFVAGWFMARTVGPRESVYDLREFMRGFLLMLGCAFAAGFIGFAYGSLREISTSTSGLAAFAVSIGVVDVPAFVRVAYIHNGGYLGALIGLIAAIILLRRRTPHATHPQDEPSLPTSPDRGKE